MTGQPQPPPQQPRTAGDSMAPPSGLPALAGAAPAAAASDALVSEEPEPAAATWDEVRYARAWLSWAVEPGNLVMHSFLADHGPLDAVRLIRSGRAPEAVGALAAARAGKDCAGDDLAAASRLGIRLVTPEDDDWPQLTLHAMEVAASRRLADSAPPQALWVRGAGRLDEAVSRAVAIVGSRAGTPYGTHVAAELAHGLAQRGWTVVSGGAYGIDGAAHRGALAAGGDTVAVVAGGLRTPYPRGHAQLFAAIAAAGLLVSEWPPDATPQRHRFLIRNRVIAGLVAGTVVVEAAARSGALSTARWSRELGRPTMAVPGPVTSALSVGAHDLVREHDARLVTGVEHVVEMIGALGADLAPRPATRRSPRDELDPLAQRVLDGFPATAAVSADRVAVSAGIPVVDVLRCLPALELRGFVRATSIGWQLTELAVGRPAGRRGGAEAR